MDPNDTKTIGYITCLDGFGLPTGTTPPGLAPDVTVAIPYSPADASMIAYTGLTLATVLPNASWQNVKVIGVIERLAWDGTVGGALKFDFYVSPQNGTLIKTLQQAALKTTKINALGWWITSYDHEAKRWYEASYPKSARTVNGVLQGKENPELNVDLTPVPAASEVDVMVHKVSLAVVPGANLQYALSFANSSTMKGAKSWGLVVGNLPPGG